MTDDVRGSHHVPTAPERYEEYVDDLPDHVQDKFEAGQQRYGDSWVDSHPDYLLRRMEEEFYEFRQAVEHYRDRDMALEEMADVVNYGLMFMAVFAEEHDG